MMLITFLQRLGGFITGGQSDRSRNNFYVEKGFQKSFVLFFTIVIIFLIIASGAFCYIFLDNFLEHNTCTIRPRVSNLVEAITPEFIEFFVEVTFAAIIIISIAVNVFMNRITKSLVFYEHQAERLAKLDFKKVVSFEADHFFNLRRSYDNLMEKYTNDLLLLRVRVARMSQLIKILSEGDVIPREKRSAFIKELGELKEVLNAKMEEYKLGKD